MMPPASEAPPSELTAVRPASRHRRKSGLLRDAVGMLLMAVLALPAGLLMNLTRARPLPLVYQTRQQQTAVAAERLASRDNASPLPDAPIVPTHEIDVDEFRRIVDEHRGPVLDARAAAFFAEGHVPGAVNLPRDEFEEKYPPLRASLERYKDREIAVYCSGPDCPDAQIEADALNRLGYRRLVIYTAGWEEWSRTGLPQEGVPVP